MRGDDGQLPFLVHSAVGTSPHVWGRRVVFDGFAIDIRNITICVWKTLKISNELNHMSFSKVPFSMNFIHFSTPSRSQPLYCGWLAKLFLAFVLISTATQIAITFAEIHVRALAIFGAFRGIRIERLA